MVTGVDIAPNLLEQARERAKREAVEITFGEGDAEQLPYGDASFDLVYDLGGSRISRSRSDQEMRNGRCAGIGRAE